MKYDFDQVIDRSQNRSSKYDERVQNFGTDQVIPLWVADMDFRTAQPIIDACVKKAEEGIWGYTSRPASYFEAVKEWEKKRNDWDVDTSLMSWSLGVVPALSALGKLYTEDGDKVMIQTPVYPEFYDVTEAWGRQVVENQLVEENGGWHVDFEDFEAKAKDEKVKVFLLCSPHNPLGIVWKPEELKKMAEICIANDVLLVSDEIHTDLIFHGKKHTPTAKISPEIASKIVTCVSATKTFNLAGLQASTTIFPNMEMKKQFDRFWMNMDIHRNNAFSSVAMEAAYREGEEWLEQLLEYISGNFDFVKEYCDKYIPRIKLIRNANNAKHDTVDVPASNMKKAIPQILLDEGYIKSFQLIDDGTQGVIRITLKYNAGKEKVISGLRRVSKPGLRVYAGADELPKVLRGLGIAIVSTSKGVMTDKKAREAHVGGEVLAFVW